MTAEPYPEPPSDALVMACVVAGGLACVTTFGAGSFARAWLNVGPSFPADATLLVGGVMAVAAARIRSRHPWPHFGLANVVTTVRLMLVGLIAAVWNQPPSLALAHAAALAGLSAVALDGFDGYLARHTRMASAFGARFDMEVDALLILVLAGLVHHMGKAGPWVLTSGLLRYGFVAAGWVWPWVARPLEPRRRRQVVCVLQIAGLLLALDPMTGVRLGWWLAAISLAALAWSFAVDVLWLRRHRR